MRKEVFARNMKFIEKHNAEANVGLHSFTVGINKFADQTPEEFFRSYRGPVPSPNVTIIQSASSVSYPERMDYREKVIQKCQMTSLLYISMNYTFVQ